MVMLLCDRMGIDVWRVDAAATKPLGSDLIWGRCRRPLHPHDLYLPGGTPVDFHTRFINWQGGQYQATYHVIDVISRSLNKVGRCLNGAKILVIGAAYKKDISDVRESPALKVIDLLRKEYADVSYHDPYVPVINAVEPFDWAMASVEMTAEKLQEADCVVITTDHSCLDYEWIVEKAKLVVDTRNATRNVKNNREKIVKI